MIPITILTAIAIASVASLYAAEAYWARFRGDSTPIRSGRDEEYRTLDESNWFDLLLTTAELARADYD